MAPSLAIYTSVLSRVYPRPGCELIFRIDQRRWSQNEGEPDFTEIISVIGRYTASAAKRLERQCTAVPHSLDLQVLFDQGVILHVDGADFYIMNMTFVSHRANIFSPDMFPLLLGCLSTIKLPESIKYIAMDTCSDRAYEEMLGLPTITNFFSYMDHVTDLFVYDNPSILFALDRLARQDDIVLFLNLKKVTLHETSEPGATEILGAFFRNRQKLEMPIPTLYIDKVTKGLDESSPLDEVTGLKIVLHNNEDMTTFEYICGVGDRWGNLL